MSAADQLPVSRLRVERLGVPDLLRYRELMLHAYATTSDVFTSTVEERAAQPESWWIRRIADPNGQSFALGAFTDGQLVGTVTIEFGARAKTRHKAKLVGMFVHESHRGRGVGAELVQTVLAEAAARPEVRIVTLTVTQGNLPAIGLYERFGFREFGIEPMAIAISGSYRAKVHMWLPLGGEP